MQVVEKHFCRKNEYLETNQISISILRKLGFVFDTKYIDMNLPFGSRGNGVDDSCMMCPSITWVRTFGFTTALGVFDSPSTGDSFVFCLSASFSLL